MLHDEYRKVNFAANIICKNCKKRNTENCQDCHVEEIRASARLQLCSELIERDTIEAEKLEKGYVICFHNGVTDIVGEVLNVSVEDNESCRITVKHPAGIYEFKTNKHNGIEYYCRIDNGRNMQDFLLYGHDMDKGASVYKYSFKTTMSCKMPTPFKSFDDILDFAETAVDEAENSLFEYETIREMHKNCKIPAHAMQLIMDAILHKQIQKDLSLDNVKIECSSIDTNDWSLGLVCECTYDVVADTEENALRAVRKKAEYHRSGIKNIQFGYPRIFTLMDTTFITNQFI